MNKEILLDVNPFANLFQTCGLEMLYQQAKARGCEDRPARAEDHPTWPPFLQRLKESGYFSSEIEGSLMYQEKLKAAKEFFLDQQQHREGEGKWDPELE